MKTCRLFQRSGLELMVNIKTDLKEIGVRGWAGFINLRIRTNGHVCENGNM
jgi:hypothetical protein